MRKLFLLMESQPIINAEETMTENGHLAPIRMIIQSRNIQCVIN